MEFLILKFIGCTIEVPVASEEGKAKIISLMDGAVGGAAKILRFSGVEFSTQHLIGWYFAPGSPQVEFAAAGKAFMQRALEEMDKGDEWKGDE